jgi:sialate O-acetylesterase
LIRNSKSAYCRDRQRLRGCEAISRFWRENALYAGVFSRHLIPAVLVVATSFHAIAEVRLPNVLADHMVVQRDKPVHVWGTADPQEDVAIEFRDNRASAVADALGRWNVYLPPGTAGGPFDLIIQGKNKIALHDILAGDIWIASGQSNMTFPMGLNQWPHSGVKNMDEEIAKANYPNLRLFQVEVQHSEYPMNDAAAHAWTAATPQSVAAFSAVAYFFGKEIVEKEGIPIGLIESDVGGSPVESWTSMDALTADATLMPVLAAWSRRVDGESDRQLRISQKGLTQEESISQAGHSKAYDAHDDPFSALFATPAQFFNAMIVPLTPFAIRGVIWYQGESNVDRVHAPLYGRLFQTMIADWRKQWGQGDFPFLFVQLANFASPEEWATVRDAQRRTLSLRNTGMAVTIDVGESNEIHARDKQDVGHRLALWARAIVYGEAVEDSGPLYRQAVPEGGKMRVWFDHADSGLVAKSGELRGFEVAGNDGQFVPGPARIEGNTVIVSSPTVPSPAFVRYGWSSDPRCNLYNRDGLPASPFTSGPSVPDL